MIPAFPWRLWSFLTHFDRTQRETQMPPWNLDEKVYRERMHAAWESDKSMNPTGLLAALEPEQKAGLDRLFTNARCGKMATNNTNTFSTSFEIGNTLTAIDALGTNPGWTSEQWDGYDNTLICVPTTKSIFLAVQQNFHAVFSFVLPPERRDYASLTDGVISIKENVSTRLRDEREDDIAMFETPITSGSYVFYMMMRPFYMNGWRGFIIYDTEYLAFDAVMPSLDSQKYTWPRRYGDENKMVIERILNSNRALSDSFVLSFAIDLGLQYLKEIRNLVKEIESKIEMVDKMAQENYTSSLSKSMLELNKCGDDVRNSRLEHLTTFAFEVVEWMYGDLQLRYQDSEALRLYKMDSKPRTLYSDPLKERIADIRTWISDVAAHQEREEQRWILEQQLWKDREAAEKKRDEEKLTRERQRQDAKDAYEKGKERQQTDRESKRFEDEEKQRADELQRQHARQDLEDKRAQDAKNLQELSIMLAQQSIELGKASLRDSNNMRGIAWLTMAFLPATFVSSFFGMNFFNVVPGTSTFDEASRSVWIFFVVAIPTTALVLMGFGYWSRPRRADPTE
jgi:Mg2+ and Co2+ transporter CorA